MIRRRLEELARSGTPLARVYDNVCSHLRMALSPLSFPYSTLSASAMQALAGIGGKRIFSSVNSEEGKKTARKPPPMCRLDKKTLGRATLEQARATLRLRADDDGVATYAGNWVIMVRRHDRRSAGPKHVTVCGFFECDGRRTRGIGRERLVKHMNLCTYARARHGADYAYLFSGSFAAAATATSRRLDVMVNARSGTWAMAKRIVALEGSLELPDDDDVLDAVVTAFAAPRVRAVVVRALGMTIRTFVKK